jgi:L-alanine-DL-glutamate epimerase-like enolase superfamily enzyme
MQRQGYRRVGGDQRRPRQSCAKQQRNDHHAAARRSGSPLAWRHDLVAIPERPGLGLTLDRDAWRETRIARG